MSSGSTSENAQRGAVVETEHRRHGSWRTGPRGDTRHDRAIRGVRDTFVSCAGEPRVAPPAQSRRRALRDVGDLRREIDDGERVGAAHDNARVVDEVSAPPDAIGALTLRWRNGADRVAQPGARRARVAPPTRPSPARVPRDAASPVAIAPAHRRKPSPAPRRYARPPAPGACAEDSRGLGARRQRSAAFTAHSSSASIRRQTRSRPGPTLPRGRGLPRVERAAAATRPLRRLRRAVRPSAPTRAARPRADRPGRTRPIDEPRRHRERGTNAPPTRITTRFGEPTPTGSPVAIHSAALATCRGPQSCGSNCGTTGWSEEGSRRAEQPKPTQRGTQIERIPPPPTRPCGCLRTSSMSASPLAPGPGNERKPVTPGRHELERRVTSASTRRADRRHALEEAASNVSRVAHADVEREVRVEPRLG